MQTVHPLPKGRQSLWMILATAIAALALAQPVLAQAPYKAPRNAFGQPDLSGTWTNASLTQLERPLNLKDLVITEA